MKQRRTTSKIVAFIGACFLVNAFATSSPQSPIGYWKTIDDLTGKPKSIIKISETQDHLLIGQITKIYPSPGKDERELCAACKGEIHNKPIVGLIILSGLKATHHQWAGGNILDPMNGKTYSCSAKIGENGKKLDIRGYIGLPLLGRSQTWERVDIMSAS